MNEQNRIARGAYTFAAVLLAAGLAACGERISDTRSKTPTPSAASPSAVVVGQAPAEPKAEGQAEPAGVTPVSPNTTEISKTTESTQKPQEGDNHSYSTTAPITPQKADGVNTTGSNK